MEGTIVCGVDGSAAAGAAARAAAELSARLGLRLVLVEVADPTAPPGDEAGGGAGPFPHERARILLERLAAEHALGGRAERRHEVGDPAERLARVAAEERADLIVIGRRRAGRFRRGAGPCLAAELAAASPCPVVVVPEDLVRPAGTVGAGSSHSTV
jgi:nucleotide-binding universal stress UspA family protein